MPSRSVAARLASAALVGLAIGWVDSRPGYDATGLTAVALLVAGAAFALLTPARWWLAGLLVGVWVPLLERSAAPLAAVAFALAGASAGRLLHDRERAHGQ